MASSGERDLRGRNILVVEDECVLALDLALMIEDAGARVEGPAYRMDQAMAIADLRTLDAAIVDVDISGTEVFPFADHLDAANVPIVFHTGRADVARLRTRYPTARIVRKPSPAPQIVAALWGAISRTPVAAPTAAF